MQPCKPADAFGRGIEQHNTFDRQTAVLGRAERQKVDAGAPGQIAGRAAERRDGIGETRAVHVKRETLRLGDFADGANLIDAIKRARFRRLGDRHRRGERVMNVVARITGRRGAQRLRCDPALVARHQMQLGAAGEKLRAIRLVDRDMGFLVAENLAPRRCHGSQRKTVRDRPRAHGHNLARGFKEIGETRVQAFGHGVLAIARDTAVVGGLQRRHDLRRDAGDVVAAEMGLGRKIAHQGFRGKSSRVPSTSPVRRSMVMICWLPSLMTRQQAYRVTVTGHGHDLGAGRQRDGDIGKGSGALWRIVVSATGTVAGLVDDDHDDQDRQADDAETQTNDDSLDCVKTSVHAERSQP